MPPQVISTGLMLLEALIGEEPAIAAELKTLFSSGTPTPADWQALRARINNFSYEHYDPGSVSATTGAAATASPAPLPPTPAIETPAAPSAPITVLTAALPPAPIPAASPAPAEVQPPAPSLSPAPAVTLPTDLASLSAIVNNATPDQLADLYKAGGLISQLVNNRWHAASTAPAQ